MTAPSLDEVALQVLVGPAAWTYHQALPAAQRVDPVATFAVLGRVPLVAADVLDAAAAAARTAAQAAAGLKAVKVEGIEIQFTPPSTADADTWTARAARLRMQDATQRRAANRTGSVTLPVEVGL